MLFYSVCVPILLVCAVVYLASYKKDTSIGTLPALIAATIFIPTAALVILHGSDQLLGLEHVGTFPGGIYLSHGLGVGLGIVVARLWYDHFR